MKRLFIAVEIDLANEFKALTQQMQSTFRNDEIIWVKNGLQHLTLRFLGETPEALIDPITSILYDIAKSTQPFELQLDKMGVFGSKYAPTTLWYGFSDFSLLKLIFEKLEKELVKIEIEENYGNFVPHITIGRIKRVDIKKRFWKTIAQLQPQFSQTLQVRRLMLIQSKLYNDGPEYRTLESFEFRVKSVE